jgi:hypothetical protein
LLINFFSWLFTQGNLDLLPMLFVGMCLWIVSWTLVLKMFHNSSRLILSNKLYKKKKRNPKYKEQYQKTKTKLQNEMRNSYWRYIENMIFDIEINEPDQPSFKNTPQKRYSHIKSQKNENTGIAPLRSEGTLHSNPSEKANILNKQFQSAFTSEANTKNPDKGPSTHSTMEPIKHHVAGKNMFE